MRYKTTPESRARLRELASPPRDDFDRVVLWLLDDFSAIETAIMACLHDDGVVEGVPREQWMGQVLRALGPVRAGE